MLKKNNSGIPPILILIIFVAAVVAMRFVFVFRWIILSGFVLIAGYFGIFYLWKFVQKNRREKAFRTSTEGIVKHRLSHCSSQINHNKKEMLEIQKNIAELEARLGASIEVPASTKKETHRLIGAFQNELKLRESKISFFEICVEKLNTLLNNYQLTQELVEKQQKLKQLQEHHYDEIADLEELKSNIEYDKFYLETIESLSNRMLESNSVDDAENLQLELEQMTKELDEL